VLKEFFRRLIAWLRRLFHGRPHAESQTDGMPIVPVYRLTATPAPYPRHRFSRDGLPDPNPTPGKPNPDEKSTWCIDRVPIYAWSDPVDGAAGLIPVYEAFAVGADGLVRYAYTTDTTPPEGYTLRPYAVFWAYPEGSAAGVPVHLLVQQTEVGLVNTRSTVEQPPRPWPSKGVLFRAEATVPVEVSVRRDPKDSRRYHFSYTPSTINLAYASTLRFVQAPRSEWKFLAVEILNGGENFEKPVVTDAVVQVRARYAEPGRDFKYRVTVQVFNGPDRLVGDPEVVNQYPVTF